MELDMIKTIDLIAEECFVKDTLTVLGESRANVQTFLSWQLLGGCVAIAQPDKDIPARSTDAYYTLWQATQSGYRQIQTWVEIFQEELIWATHRNASMYLGLSAADVSRIWLPRAPNW
jgi:hypothetical protein